LILILCLVTRLIHCMLRLIALFVAYPLLVFFFFQAEDGIRDFHVTGVQTCALPIFESPESATDFNQIIARVTRLCSHTEYEPKRSEERRVGKECRSRWSQYH